MRKAGNRVRVSGQLVDAITGTHLWVDRFEGTLEDIFDLQDKVTTSVVSAMAPTIRRAEIERARHRPTESTDAHLTHMRGVGNFYQWNKAGMEEALRLFYEAMKIDPDFSLPYGMAANCYVSLRATGWVADFAPFVPKVVELVAKAPAVGRDDAFTLGSAGFAAANILNDLDAGAALLDRALALNANFAQVWVQSAYVRAWLGEPELALAQPNVRAASVRSIRRPSRSTARPRWPISLPDGMKKRYRLPRWGCDKTPSFRPQHASRWRVRRC